MLKLLGSDLSGSDIVLFLPRKNYIRLFFTKNEKNSGALDMEDESLGLRGLILKC